MYLFGGNADENNPPTPHHLSRVLTNGAGVQMINESENYHFSSAAAPLSCATRPSSSLLPPPWLGEYPPLIDHPRSVSYVIN